MGNSPSSSTDLVTHYTLLRLDAIPEDTAGAEAVFAKLLPLDAPVAATDLFSAIEAEHVREMQLHQPRNLARLVLKAVEILEGAISAPRLLTAIPGASTRVLNAVRLLTRVVPILLEEGDGDGTFVARLFWDNELPTLASGRGGSGSTSGNAVGVGLPIQPAEAAAAAAPPPPALGVTRTAAMDWLPRERSDGAIHSQPLGITLLHAVMALLFAPDVSIHPTAHAMFTVKMRAAERRGEQLRQQAAAAAAGGGAGSGGAVAAVREGGAGAPAKDATAVEVAEAGAPAAPPAPVEGSEVEGEQDGVVPSTSNAVWPTLLWAPGISFPTLRVLPATPEWITHRTELLRLLTSLCCGPLYVHPTPSAPTRTRFLDAATSPHCVYAPCLFFSLLNTVIGYDPIGFGVPYATSVVGNREEPLAAASLHALLVLLDYAPIVDAPPSLQQQQEEEDNTDAVVPRMVHTQFNVYRSLLATLNTTSDLRLLFDGLVRLLAAVPYTAAAVLPGAYVGLEWHREVLMLIWKLCDENPAFAAAALSAPHNGLVRLTAPLCWIMMAGRHDPTAVGLEHLCTFLLLLLSGDRGCGVALNSHLSAAGGPLRSGVGGGVSGPAPLHPDVPPLSNDGSATHADLLFVTLHACIIDASPRLSPLYACFLTIIQNVSPYARGLTRTSSARLLGLVELFSSPSFLFARPGNAAFVGQLLDSLANIIQYQFNANCILVYAILRRRVLFERLSSVTVRRHEEEVAARAARRALLAAAVSAATAAGAAGAKAGASSTAAAAAVAAAAAASAAAAEEEVAHPLVEESAWMQRNASPDAGLRTPAAAPTDTSVTVAAGGGGAAASSAAGDEGEGWVATDAWLDSVRASMPLPLILRLIDLCVPRIEEFVASKAGGGVDDDAIVKFLASETLVGVLPVPHAILMRRYGPNAFTQLWMTTFMWSTLFLALGREVPLFDARKVRLFAISVAK